MKVGEFFMFHVVVRLNFVKLQVERPCALSSACSCWQQLRTRPFGGTSCSLELCLGTITSRGSATAVSRARRVGGRGWRKNALATAVTAQQMLQARLAHSSCLLSELKRALECEDLFQTSWPVEFPSLRGNMTTRAAEWTPSSGTPQVLDTSDVRLSR